MNNNDYIFPLSLNIILADDDEDDRLLFKEIVEELPLNIALSTFHNGEHLMLMLFKESIMLPHAIFLDINMPRKSGYDCLTEIKRSKKLMHIPVIIYSTSYEQKVADLMYDNGAHYYIQKPAAYATLKHIIHKALRLIADNDGLQPAKENFLLTDKRK